MPAGQGHPRRNASPLWAFSRWIFPRQAPVRRGPIPRASVRRNAPGASEGPARSPTEAASPAAAARRLPSPARAAQHIPLPPLGPVLLLFPMGIPFGKASPKGMGKASEGAPARFPGRLAETPGAAQPDGNSPGERLGERAAEPLPKRPDGLTRALQHGPLQRGFRQVPEGPHPRAHNVGRFRHVVAEEVREPYERGLGVLLGDAEREDFPERLSGTPFRTTRAHRRGRGRSPDTRRAGSCAGA